MSLGFLIVNLRIIIMTMIFQITNLPVGNDVNEIKKAINVIFWKFKKKYIKANKQKFLIRMTTSLNQFFLYQYQQLLIF